ncbi:MAG TPA: DUF4142 domain-containing protein [Casimicrobiaceae bacterium]|nr:DUF4142 domain-containing protein [Casimicrobiaceae bacterium]
MKRTSIAAAVAALFILSAPGLYAQPTTATSSSPSAAASASGPGATATTTKGDTKMSASASSKLDRADRKFIEKAAEDGMKEVEVSRTVADKASDPGVKAFAERMVKDHTEANKKLMDLAQSKGLQLPTDLKRGDRKDVDKMAKMDPDKMDRSYMKDQVKDHKKDVKEFEKEAKNAKDPDVKKFAADTLPTLQEHLKLAQDTEDKVKGGGSAATRSSAAPAPAPTASSGMAKETAKK